MAHQKVLKVVEWIWDDKRAKSDEVNEDFGFIWFKRELCGIIKLLLFYEISWEI